MEILTLILSLYGQTALPSASNVGINGSMTNCIQSLDPLKTYKYERCVSLSNPGKTFHITGQVDCRNQTPEMAVMGFSNCKKTEHLNLFVKDGEVFEIPMSELLNFYNIKPQGE